MASILNEIVIDAHDPAAQAAWWSQVLGWPITQPWGEGSFGIEPPGEAGRRILFEPVPEAKSVKNRLHLDVEPSEATIEQELERLLTLGARRADIGQGDVPWVVLADPEGNEFCLIPAQDG
jgi:predicted enzyme related to lactoylglutathione lyase